MKLHIETIRSLIREAFDEALDELVSKDMPNGSAWKTKGKGWGAKNAHGVTNYYYGDDEAKNKKSADAFRSDTKKTKVDALKKEDSVTELHISTLQNYKSKAKSDINSKLSDVERGSTASTKSIQKRAQGLYNAGRNLRQGNYTGGRRDKKSGTWKKGKYTGGPDKKSGTWKTDSGKEAKRNPDGSIKYTEKK